MAPLTAETAHRPAIPPVAAGLARPRWSVMIPTYECAHFLSDALQSVLKQDPGPETMQIEVIDDCSADDPAAVVAAVGRGRIAFHRQQQNRGLHGNLTDCLKRARGEFVHLLHGDDQVLPGFYQAIERGFVDPKVGAAFCRWQLIDAKGNQLEKAEPLAHSAGSLPDVLALLASEQRIVSPSIVVRRSVWEELGGFDRRLSSAEDWESWVRIASRHAIHYEPCVLASYRMHGASATARAMKDAREMRDTARAMSIFSPLLPADRRAAILRAAGRRYAARSIERGRDMNEAGRYVDANAHALMAVRFSMGPRTLRSALAIWLRLS